MYKCRSSGFLFLQIFVRSNTKGQLCLHLHHPGLMTACFLILCQSFCCQICNKLWCTVYSGSFLSEPAWPSSAILATVAHLLAQLSLPTCINESRPWHQHVPVTSSPLFLLWSIFERYWPLETLNNPQELQFLRRSDSLFLTLSHFSTNVHFLPNGDMMKHLSVLTTQCLIAVGYVYKW